MSASSVAAVRSQNANCFTERSKKRTPTEDATCLVHKCSVLSVVHFEQARQEHLEQEDEKHPWVHRTLLENSVSLNIWNAIAVANSCAANTTITAQQEGQYYYLERATKPKEQNYQPM